MKVPGHHGLLTLKLTSLRIMTQFSTLEKTIAEHNRSTATKLNEITASIGDLKCTVDIVTRRVRDIEAEVKKHV